jgi:hypothetical protein
MDTFIKTIADLFAAVLGRVGYVGKPRRRADIRDNMKLVTELAEHPDIGRGSWPHQALMNRIALDVGRLAGVSFKTRKIPWGSVVLALLIGVPCGYWAYVIDRDAWHWYSVFPGLVAVLMALTTLGMIISPPEQPQEEDESTMKFAPLAGDVNASPSTPPPQE